MIISDLMSPFQNISTRFALTSIFRLILSITLLIKRFVNFLSKQNSFFIEKRANKKTNVAAYT